MKTLKDKLANQKLAIGAWSMIGHPTIIEIMANAGFDWVCIDLEHTSITYEQHENMIRAADIAGIPTLTRLTSARDENQIKRVMDNGSAGIIVPMVRNAQDAIAAIQAMQYPPLGHRGVSLNRGTKFGIAFNEYREWLKTEAVCIVQIEHIDAVKHCEEIFSLDTVDGYFLGPYDLSASMGLIGQLDHPDVLDAMDRVQTIAKKMNKSGGMHVVEPNEAQLERVIKKGFNFIAYSIDTRIIDVACRSALEKVKSMDLHSGNK